MALRSPRLTAIRRVRVNSADTAATTTTTTTTTAATTAIATPDIISDDGASLTSLPPAPSTASEPTAVSGESKRSGPATPRSSFDATPTSSSTFTSTTTTSRRRTSSGEQIVNVAKPAKLTHLAIQQVFGSRPAVAVEASKRKRGSLSHRELASIIGSRATGHLRHRRIPGTNTLPTTAAEVAGSRATARKASSSHSSSSGRRRSRNSGNNITINTTSSTSTSSTSTPPSSSTEATSPSSSSSSSSSSSAEATSPKQKLSHAEIAAQLGGNAHRARRRTLFPSHRDIARTFGQLGRNLEAPASPPALSPIRSDGGTASADEGSASDISDNPALRHSRRNGPSHAAVAAVFGSRGRAALAANANASEVGRSISPPHALTTTPASVSSSSSTLPPPLQRSVSSPAVVTNISSTITTTTTSSSVTMASRNDATSPASTNSESTELLPPSSPSSSSSTHVTASSGNEEGIVDTSTRNDIPIVTSDDESPTSSGTDDILLKRQRF